MAAPWAFQPLAFIPGGSAWLSSPGQRMAFIPGAAHGFHPRGQRMAFSTELL